MHSFTYRVNWLCASFSVPEFCLVSLWSFWGCPKNKIHVSFSVQKYSQMTPNSRRKKYISKLCFNHAIKPGSNPDETDKIFRVWVLLYWRRSEIMFSCKIPIALLH